MNPPVTIERCWCGRCQMFWLKGIGSFVQGSGFTEQQAKRIAELINQDKDFPK